MADQQTAVVTLLNADARRRRGWMAIGAVFVAYLAMVVGMSVTQARLPLPFLVVFPAGFLFVLVVGWWVQVPLVGAMSLSVSAGEAGRRTEETMDGRVAVQHFNDGSTRLQGWSVRKLQPRRLCVRIIPSDGRTALTLELGAVGVIGPGARDNEVWLEEFGRRLLYAAGPGDLSDS